MHVAIGVVFAIAFFLALAGLAHFTGKRVIDKPLQEGRARNSRVAEVVDDILNHRWRVIIGLAVLIIVDRRLGVFGGLLQSRLVLAAMITMFFVGRLLLRRSANQSEGSQS